MLLRLGDLRTAISSNDVTASSSPASPDGQTWSRSNGLVEVTDIRTPVLRAGESLGFRMFDVDNSLRRDADAGWLRMREVEVYVLWDYAGEWVRWYRGTLDSFKFENRVLVGEVDSWFAGLDTVKARQTTTAHQKAVDPTDTCFDELDGGNAQESSRLNWESQ